MNKYRIQVSCDVNGDYESSIVDNYTKEVQANSKYLKKDVVSNSFDTNCEKILENKYQKVLFDILDIYQI